MINGIDVSGYQADIYPTQGLSFVVVKATEGTSYVNPKYAAQLATARKAGLVVGHYHFEHHGTVQAQVDYFSKHVDLHPHDFIALDWEQRGLTTADKDAWLKAVKAKFPSHKVILYTYTSMWKGEDTTSFVQDGLWIADPNRPAGQPGIVHPWLFHQYSSSGGVDHNVGNFKDKAALAAWTGVVTAKPAPSFAPFPGRAFFRIGQKSLLITAMGKRLVAEGYRGYDKGPGPTFTRADIKAYAWYQRKLGYKGSDADGIPGPASWARLRVPKP